MTIIRSLWQQTKGQFIGRRGRIARVDTKVTLDPEPGSCSCPLQQRRTSINVATFYREWRRVEEMAT